MHSIVNPVIPIPIHWALKMFHHYYAYTILVFKSCHIASPGIFPPHRIEFLPPLRRHSTVIPNDLVRFRVFLVFLTRVYTTRLSCLCCPLCSVFFLECNKFFHDASIVRITAIFLPFFQKGLISSTDLPVGSHSSSSTSSSP